jgi:hypothetical protein
LPKMLHTLARANDVSAVLNGVKRERAPATASKS